MLSQDVARIEEDPRCETCGRSIAPRYGGQPFGICESCLHDGDRIEEAAFRGWEAA